MSGLLSTLSAADDRGTNLLAGLTALQPAYALQSTASAILASQAVGDVEGRPNVRTGEEEKPPTRQEIAGLHDFLPRGAILISRATYLCHPLGKHSAWQVAQGRQGGLSGCGQGIQSWSRAPRSRSCLTLRSRSLSAAAALLSRRNNRRGFVVLLSGLASARPARLLSIRNFSRFFSSIITHSHGSRSSMADSLSKSMSSTPSVGKEDDRFPAAGNHAKPADFRSKVLAVGGVSGTYEELTGHKQELKVSMSVWVSPKP